MIRWRGRVELEYLGSPAEFERWLEPLENMSWIVRCGDNWDRRKADFGPEATEKVVQYLANYVGRMALSDSRILDIQGDEVLFKYKDYRDNNQQKAEWIDGVELIHRFLQHLLATQISTHSPLRLDGTSREARKTRLHPAVHGLSDVGSIESGEQDEEQDEASLDEQERTQTCRFCAGDMHVTRSHRASSCE